MTHPAIRRTRLDALTSLRFFAAFAIVLHHSRGTLIPLDTFSAWALDHGVSLFFVLSGFILVYVYPEINGARAAVRFWVARIARVWPAHIVALILAIVVVGLGVGTSGWPLPLLANVALIHAWVPLHEYFFSYNAVSWSISTELGFYVLFPLLIINFQSTWWWKLLLAGGLLIGIMIACQMLDVPPLDLSRSEVTTYSLLYISPLGRLFEFVLGMSTAVLWQRMRDVIVAAGLLWTIVELAALTLALWCVSLGTVELIALTRLGPLPIAVEWLAHAGSCVGFALLIFSLASGSGLVGSALSYRAVVYLGEISYTMYLLHQVMITAFVLAGGLNAPLPGWMFLPVFVAVLIAASAGIFVLIESPARNWIKSLI